LLLSEENFRLLRQIFFGFGEESYCTKPKQARFVSFSLTLGFTSLRFPAYDFTYGIFSEFEDLLRSYAPSRLATYQEDYALKSSMLGKDAAERLIEQEKVNKQ
jgi:hypothetical protein